MKSKQSPILATPLNHRRHPQSRPFDVLIRSAEFGRVLCPLLVLPYFFLSVCLGASMYVCLPCFFWGGHGVMDVHDAW